MSSDTENPCGRQSDPNPLAPEFHKARTLIVVTSVVAILHYFGVKFHGRLPFLDISLPQQEVLSWVCVAILAYGLFRLVVEWCQCSLERRQKTASRIDYAVTILIAIGTLFILLYEPVTDFSLPSHAILIPAVAILVLGLLCGAYLSTVLWNLQFVRSKVHAKQLALPRIPVAVRCAWMLGLFLIPPIVLLFLLSLGFNEPLAELWTWLFWCPIVLFFFSEVLSRIPRSITLSDGTKVSRAEHLQRIQKAFDYHDAS